jgi:hypothetical protein
VIRIDILVSALPKGINELEQQMEEENLRQAIGKLLGECGYTKFVVVGGSYLNKDTKAKVALD